MSDENFKKLLIVLGFVCVGYLVNKWIDYKFDYKNAVLESQRIEKIKYITEELSKRLQCSPKE